MKNGITIVKQVTATITIGLLAVIVAACGKPRPPTACVVGGRDVSPSVTEFDNRFGANIDRLLAFVAARRGTATLDVIDGNVLAGFSARYSVAFEPDPALGGNDRLINEDLAAKARKAAAEAEAALTTGGQTPGSDTLGFALAAAPVLERCGGEPYLIYLSDMIQRAPRADALNLYAPLTERQIEAAVNRLAAAEKVADLHGVRVIVIGGGRSNGAVSADQAIVIEKFWRSYFTEAGAKVVGWGPEFQPPAGT